MKKKLIIKLAIIILAGSMISGSAVYFKFFGNKKSIIEVENYLEDNGGTADLQKAEKTEQNIEINSTIKQGVSTNVPQEKTILAEEKMNIVEKIEADKKAAIKIIAKLMSSGYRKSSARNIDTIIIHSSYDAIGNDPFSINGIIKEYSDYGVSAHYLIGRDGKIYQLVEDKNIAYHAGISKMPDGRINVNEFSIGIELVNTKTDKFTDAQYKALKNLINELKNNYKIKNILGHNQIAPERKDDPWNFEWNNI